MSTDAPNPESTIHAARLAAIEDEYDRAEGALLQALSEVRQVKQAGDGE